MNCHIAYVVTLLCTLQMPSAVCDELLTTVETQRALGAIIGEPILEQNTAGIRAEAGALSDAERMGFLADWVLPNSYRSTIRMAADFSQTYPRPTADVHSNRGARSASGGDLVAPAIDLLAAARRLGALPKLRVTVDEWSPPDRQQELAKAAFLAAIAVSAKRFDDANRQLEQLRELIQVLPVTRAERGAEAVATWIAIGHPETQEAAGDLLLVLYEQARNKIGPRSERWHRHIYSLKQDLETRFTTAENLRFNSQDHALRNWHAVSRATSETCGLGYPLAKWDTRPGRVRHVTSHDHDYLYYASPIQGDFVVEADVTTFGFRDIHLGYGNVWAGPGFDLKGCLVGEFRGDFPVVPIQPKLADPGEEMRVRLEVRNGVRTTSINGRNVFQVQQSAGGDPWLAIHSAWYANGTVRNLVIKGAPNVPAEINLMAMPDLPGWLPYFDESVGHAEADWRADSSGELSVLRGLRNESVDTDCESLLRYHRPMLEDGTIEYEFFYRDSVDRSFRVHPALGRLVFMMSPNGVRTHWVTDGRSDTTGLSPANITDEPEHRRGPETLPLNNDAWNRLRLKLAGNRVDLYLNDQMVCSRMLESTNQRTFGLFHYADQTETQVRNLRWRGSWRRRLPEVVDQELVEDPVHRLVADGAALPLVLDHSFENGLPARLFSVFHGKRDSNIVPKFDGVHVTQTGADGTSKVSFGPDFVLEGDFEITATFEDLNMNVAKGGNCNCHLMLEIGDIAKSSCRLFRKNQSQQDQALFSSIFKTIDGQRQYLFPKYRAEKSTAGQLRFLRRDNLLHYMYAASETDSFRLIDTQKVGTEPTLQKKIELVIETEKRGMTSAVWKRLTIRGQKMIAKSAAPLSMSELNQSRDQLSVLVDHDFRTEQAPATNFRRLGQTQFVDPLPEGLSIVAPGSNAWTASGLILRPRLTADFDVSVDVQVVRLGVPRINHETMLVLQTEFNGSGSPAVEVKYQCAPNGQIELQAQTRYSDNDGRTEWKVVGRVNVADLQSMRTARRGKSVYLLYRESQDSEWKLLKALHIEAAEVSAQSPRLMLHTGGANLQSQVWLRRMTVAAE